MSGKESRATITSIAAKLPSPGSMQLAMLLQTTLDLPELLTIFTREVSAFAPYDCVVLRSTVRGLEVQVGGAGAHRCAYSLSLMGEELGEIEFSRGRPFGEAELAAVESMLSALLYPLRNALAYNDARCAAYKDPLTGMGNRLALEESLPREIHLARRHRHSLALLALDLDHFKRINDSHGHPIGDSVLRSAAHRILGSVRTSDQAFRFGGEEFVVLLNNTTEEGALMVAERIRQSVDCTITHCSDTAVQVTVSIGIAMLSEKDESASLFANADVALYCAKANGRNRVELYRAR